jgi:hypothetical protein
MARNKYFNFFNDEAEQKLIEDLVVESIEIYAHDMWYLPRTGVNKTDILNEYQYNKFTHAIDVEMYIKNVSAFEGDGQFLGKFNIEIRDQITLTMSIRSFKRYIEPITSEKRPLEGDCIYVPMLKALYQVKYVDNANVYYSLGALQMMDITCELMEVSGEEFTTGITEIDSVYNTYDNNPLEAALTTESGEYVTTEDGVNIISDEYDPEDISDKPFANNIPFQTEGDAVLDFSETSPFGENF